jgi:epoxyqueuosine reductase
MILEYKKISEKLLKKFDFTSALDFRYYIEYCNKNNIKYEGKEYKSLIVVLKGYTKTKTNDKYKLGGYCYHNNDYHRYLKELVLESNLEFEYDFYVDNSPFNEKIAGLLSNLGFIGKNNLLINEKLGSYFNIGIIAFNDELDYYDQFLDLYHNMCDDCNRCINACKMHALENGFIKTNCKSYLTQYKNDKLDYMFNNLIIGCDTCMEACKYNKDVLIKEENKTIYNNLNLEYLLNVSNRQFKKDFKDCTINFIHKDIIIKNILLLELKNKNYEYLKSLKELINNNDSLYLNEIKNILKKEEII